MRRAGRHAVASGFGLYLVRRYTELLGGEVTVESTLGEGSTLPSSCRPRRRGADGCRVAELFLKLPRAWMCSDE